MLKEETLKLIDLRNAGIRDIFSLCIGTSYLRQRRSIDLLGKYGRWDTDVREGTLKLDGRKYNVEYIGTTSDEDGFWYSSEMERVIPDKYVTLMVNTRKRMETLGIKKLTEGRIPLSGEITGYELSMIYIAFAPENTACFCGSGSPAIYMFVKDLPGGIFAPLTSAEFAPCAAEIISAHEVDQRLMVRALLCENGIGCKEGPESIEALFGGGRMTVIFDSKGRATNISGCM